MGAVGRAGATLGEMPGTGRPGGHLQTVLGSRQTRKHRLQPAPPYLCGAPASGTDNTTERPASSGNGATAVGGASTWRSVDAQVPTASRLLEVGSPRPAIWRSSPCLWKGYCCEAGLPWEEGLAGAEACRGRGLQGPVPRTEVGNRDWGPHTAAALAPPPGRIGHPSLPTPPPNLFGEGGSGGRVCSSPCIQFSPPSSCLESGSERSLSSLPRPSLPAVKVDKQPLCLQASCTESVRGAGEAAQAFPTACTLHSLKWAQPGRLARRARGTGRAVCLYSVTRDSLKWVRRGPHSHSRARSFPSEQ